MTHGKLDHPLIIVPYVGFLDSRFISSLLNQLHRVADTNIHMRKENTPLWKCALQNRMQKESELEIVSAAELDENMCNRPYYEVDFNLYSYNCKTCA